MEFQICHNPYFSRWFSAMIKMTNKLGHRWVTILILVDGFLQYKYLENLNGFYNCHNPYFSRWFSAIALEDCESPYLFSHNPYFSRWFSAIMDMHTSNRNI